MHRGVLCTRWRRNDDDWVSHPDVRVGNEDAEDPHIGRQAHVGTRVGRRHVPRRAMHDRPGLDDTRSPQVDLDEPATAAVHAAGPRRVRNLTAVLTPDSQQQARDGIFRRQRCSHR